MTALFAQMRMELRFQMRNPFFWFSVVVFFALSFSATLEDAFGNSGYIWVNGGNTFAGTAVMLSILGLIAVAGIIGESLSRDSKSGAEELVLVSGAGRFSRGLGKFIVGFGAILVVGATIVPGIYLATLTPGIAEERLGPTNWGHFAMAMVVFIVPNFFIMSALIYAIAARFKSQTIAFMAALGLIAFYIITMSLLGRDVYRHDVFQYYALLDPFGRIAGSEFVITWTVAQHNEQFTPFSGLLLMNRAIWMMFAGALLFWGTLKIPRDLATEKKKPLPKVRNTRFASLREKIPISISENSLWIFYSWEMKSLLRQPGVMLMMFFAVVTLWLTAQSAGTYGFSLPTTDLLIHTSSYYFDKVLILLVVWCSADLIWRERHYKVHEIVDAMPTSDITCLAAKTLALFSIVLTFWSLSIVVNILYQVTHGFYNFELWLYLTDTFLYKAPHYLWMAGLAITMQAIVRQRYIAIAIVLIIYLSGALFDAFGLYHPVYRFGEVSFFWYSLMDGYGHFSRAHVWFVAYWSFAVAFLWLLGCACYARGSTLNSRFSVLKERLSRGSVRWWALAAGSLWAVTGVIIVHQSTVLNTWPKLSENDLMAYVEKNFRAEWGQRLQPRIVGIRADVDLYPSERGIRMAGDLRLRNDHDEPIEELLLFFSSDLTLKTVRFPASATLVDEQSDGFVQIWRLDTPLMPGDECVLSFETENFPSAGFAVHARHDGIPEVSSVEVVGNGSNVLNLNMIPQIGYSERLEHKPSWRRKKYGLPELWTLPKSTVGVNVAHDTTHLAWVDEFDVMMTTDADQFPLHGGRLVKDYGVVDGRRKIHYQVEGKSRGWSALMSARYSIHRVEREGLPAVELYHHPEHAYTLDPFAESLLDAMAYYTKYYGPAPFETFRVGQSAGHYNSLGARSGLGFATEFLIWKTDLKRSGGSDIDKYAALFMGASWWADQIIPANVEGAKLLWAGMPHITAGLFLHRKSSVEESRKVRLQSMRELFRTRAKLQDEELPFSLEMKDSSILMQKGPLVIVYLAELLGEDQVEQILGSFIESWKFKANPYPSARDLIEHIKAQIPAEDRPLITDLFERITNWKLRVVKADARLLPDGRWEVTAEIDAKKLYTEGIGLESEEPFDTPLFFGVFSGDGYSEGEILYHQLHRLDPGQTQIKIIVDEVPTRFGVDPYLYLPDPNPYDNVKKITISR